MRSRRMAAAMSALAVVAGGLVSAVVVGGAQPAFADCEITEQRPPGAQQEQDQPDRAPREQEQGNRQDQDQGLPQDQQDQDDPPQQNQENPGPDDRQDQDQGARQNQQDQIQGGALVRDPIADPEPTAETFGRRDRDRDRFRDPRRGRDNPRQPSNTPSPSPTAGQGSDCDGIGPFVTDFVDIRQISRSRFDARTSRGGSFVSRCGTNGEGHFNPDNFIVAPGVRNGAHHLHDYVGNLSTDAFSTDESLEAADTTCRLGDKSTYFWPVLRDRTVDENADDPDRNVGEVLRPRAVTLQFRGNARARVVAMPRFLRIITGDAKAATNGPANARAGWSCSGFTDRVSPDKYPLCPGGSQVLRILDFPSCWDGQNTDSANHRTHIVFPDQNGACPQGTQPVPQLRMTLAYSVPRGASFALDAFPEQLHNPVTDHGDFVNVMPDRLMSQVVNCINRGRRC